MISNEARAAFLRRIHLFHDVKDEDLGVIAGMLKEETFVPEEHVFVQGEEANRFFIIYQGTVQITQLLEKEVRDLAQLVDGDYFGEEALLARRKHSATVIATQKSEIFSLTAEQLFMLLKQFPRLKAALDVGSDSRRLARKLNFKWLQPGEVIYFMARKHEVLLAQALSGPLLASAVPIIFAIYFFITRSFFTILSAGIYVRYHRGLGRLELYRLGKRLLHPDQPAGGVAREDRGPIRQPAGSPAQHGALRGS